MVYCTKCGAKNEEDAAVCVKCGASLATAPPSRRYERKRVEDECFGIPHGGIIVGLAIGVIILISGIIMFLREAFPTAIPEGLSPGSFAVIIIGILIIVGAYLGLRRRYY